MNLLRTGRRSREQWSRTA